MLKAPFFCLFVLIASACALGPRDGTPSNSVSFPFFSSRQIASRDKNCVLSKHPHENVYQLRVDGRPYSEFWYDLAYGERLLEQLRENGTCTGP